LKVIPRLHDTTGCQTGLTTGLTTGCIVQTGFRLRLAHLLISARDTVGLVCVVPSTL